MAAYELLLAIKNDRKRQMMLFQTVFDRVADIFTPRIYERNIVFYLIEDGIVETSNAVISLPSEENFKKITNRTKRDILDSVISFHDGNTNFALLWITLNNQNIASIKALQGFDGFEIELNQPPLLNN